MKKFISMLLIFSILLWIWLFFVDWVNAKWKWSSWWWSKWWSSWSKSWSSYNKTNASSSSSSSSSSSTTKNNSSINSSTNSKVNTTSSSSYNKNKTDQEKETKSQNNFDKLQNDLKSNSSWWSSWSWSLWGSSSNKNYRNNSNNGEWSRQKYCFDEYSNKVECKDDKSNAKNNFERYWTHLWAFVVWYWIWSYLNDNSSDILEINLSDIQLLYNDKSPEEVKWMIGWFEWKTKEWVTIKSWEYSNSNMKTINLFHELWEDIRINWKSISDQWNWESIMVNINWKTYNFKVYSKTPIKEENSWKYAIEEVNTDSIDNSFSLKSIDKEDLNWVLEKLEIYWDWKTVKWVDWIQLERIIVDENKTKKEDKWLNREKWWKVIELSHSYKKIIAKVWDMNWEFWWILYIYPDKFEVKMSWAYSKVLINNKWKIYELKYWYWYTQTNFKDEYNVEEMMNWLNTWFYKSNIRKDSSAIIFFISTIFILWCIWLFGRFLRYIWLRR